MAANKSCRISASALEKTAATNLKNFQKFGCTPNSMLNFPLVPSLPLFVAGTIKTLISNKFQSCLEKSPLRHWSSAYFTRLMANSLSFYSTTSLAFLVNRWKTSSSLSGGENGRAATIHTRWFKSSTFSYSLWSPAPESPPFLNLSQTSK